MASLTQLLEKFTPIHPGSDNYCAKRGRELEAVMQQKGLGTAFLPLVLLIIIGTISIV